MAQYSSLSAEDLVHACVESRDAAAWAEFIRRFRRVIAGVALRTARQWVEPTPEIIDDLVQETYLKLCDDNCRLLCEFHPYHPDAIFGYLKLLTTNVVRDHFKAVNAQKRGAGQTNLPLSEVEFTACVESPGGPEALDRGVLLGEIDQCLNECAPGPTNAINRTIFLLYYRLGLSAGAIAALPSIKLGTKGVETVILRLTRLVRERIAPLSGSGDKSESVCS